MGRHRKRRVPKLAFTKTRGIGWHVNYRDPITNSPRRYRFGMIDEGKAADLYMAWLADHLRGKQHVPAGDNPATTAATTSTANDVAQPGSLLAVASSYLSFEERRTRKPGEPRRAGTISKGVLADKRTYVREFLKFMNRRHGQGHVAKSSVLDLSMQDVEAYNKELVDGGYSDELVTKRFLEVKGIIDRASRPEHGEQRLPWNWNSRDKLRGKAGKPRTLPTVEQLEGIFSHCDVRTRAMVWMAIGLGFGQSDLSAVRVGQVDANSYDLRRGKTGLERFGETPPGVWAAIREYLKEYPRKEGELLFTTRTGEPLVHGSTDTIHLWWVRLRQAMGETSASLEGFYVLRHLGATEYGSRPGCSISGIRRWLGHAASSSVADVYMRPVAPEQRAVVEWVRKRLLSSKAPTSLTKPPKGTAASDRVQKRQKVNRLPSQSTE